MRRAGAEGRRGTEARLACIDRGEQIGATLAALVFFAACFFGLRSALARSISNPRKPTRSTCLAKSVRPSLHGPPSLHERKALTLKLSFKLTCVELEAPS